MKLDRHDNVKYVHTTHKLRSNNLIKYYHELVGEFDTEYLEVVSRKRAITDQVPGQFVTIYICRSDINFQLFTISSYLLIASFIF